MTLPEVIRRVTSTPAACIGLAGVVGTLAPGALADVSVFRLASGEWVFRDSALEPETGSTRLEPVAAVRGGRVVACSPAVY